MTIKIIPKSDVYVTEIDLAQYRFEYENFLKYYSGPPIPFEDFIRTERERKELFSTD